MPQGKFVIHRRGFLRALAGAAALPLTEIDFTPSHDQDQFAHKPHQGKLQALVDSFAFMGDALVFTVFDVRDKAIGTWLVPGELWHVTETGRKMNEHLRLAVDKECYVEYWILYCGAMPVARGIFQNEATLLKPGDQLTIASVEIAYP